MWSCGGFQWYVLQNAQPAISMWAHSQNITTFVQGIHFIGVAGHVLLQDCWCMLMQYDAVKIQKCNSSSKTMQTCMCNHAGAGASAKDLPKQGGKMREDAGSTQVSPCYYICYWHSSFSPSPCAIWIIYYQCIYKMHSQQEIGSCPCCWCSEF